MWMLAQMISLSEEDWHKLIVGAIITIGIMAAGLFLIQWLRRRLKHSEVEEQAMAATPFSLNDLRKMMLDGKLSDAEYHKLKDAMVAKARKSVFGDPKPGIPKVLRDSMPPPAEEGKGESGG